MTDTIFDPPSKSAPQAGGVYSFKDFEKIKRLRATFARNERVRRLFRDYLTDFPTFLKKEMVEELCADGSITPEYAIAAILCAAFGLDTEASAEDRIIERRYIIPAIRILDAEKYYNDPYYRTVRIPSCKRGRWELRHETYEPYRAVVASDVEPEGDMTEVVPLGFFPNGFAFPAVLQDGNEWMTLTPVDLDTCAEPIRAAHGDVITFGLGLGYYAFMAAQKPQVRSVTVVELDPEVIALFSEMLLPQFPNAHKIRIVCDDCFHYAEQVMPSERFDVAFVDTWRDASDGYEMYLRMKACEEKNPKTTFLYWVEEFLLSRLRDDVFHEITDTAVAAFGNDPPTAVYEQIVRALDRSALRAAAVHRLAAQNGAP